MYRIVTVYMRTYMRIMIVSSLIFSVLQGMQSEDDFDLLPEHEYQDRHGAGQRDGTPPGRTPGGARPAGDAGKQNRHAMPTGTIGSIIVEGNVSIPTYTILSKIPYRVGDLLRSSKTRLAIKNIYSLGVVSCVQISADYDDAGRLVLIISVTEKQPIERIVLEGNSALTSKFITKKLDLANLVAIDEGDFYSLEQRIRKLYGEKNYHQVTFQTRFQDTANGRKEVHITINEGKQTHIRRVMIQGNRVVSAAQIKKILVTRENWLFGFLDHSGSYQEGMLEYDRHLIEELYQNNGYIAVQVAEPIVTPVPDSSDIDVTFVIEEGDQYRVSKVTAQEHKLLSEAEQLAAIPVRPGQIFSRELVQASIENLRMLVGEYGYINADVIPNILPDTEKREVAIEFSTSLGGTVYAHKITVVGNSRTDDAVIRRNITINEGDLITTQQMEISKNRVLALGFFEPRSGAHWNMIRHSEQAADLELIVKEVKTGSFMLNLGVDGDASDANAPWKKVKVALGAQNTNWFGRGIQGNVSASYAADQTGIDLTIADPWLLDRPIYGSLTAYHHRSSAEDKFTPDAPPELSTAVFVRVGLTVEQLDNVSLTGDVGVENICFPALNDTVLAALDMQGSVAKSLTMRKRQSGNIVSLGCTLIQDVRNHPVYPTDGYLLNGTVKVAVPHTQSPQSFSFLKGEFDGQWYAPVINEYDLVFRFHLFAGVVKPIHRYSVPFRELYHVGGPATVRGFTFGQIGPVYNGTLLGSTHSLVVNAELLFPIKIDASIRGVIFYDGGSGWGTPNADLLTAAERDRLQDHFDYRHAIGFGIRLTNPMPISVDVGFKLDRRKRLGESLSEVHFNMTRSF